MYAQIGFVLNGWISDNDLRAVADVIRIACTAAPRGEVLRALALMRSSTIARPSAETDTVLILAAYADELDEFPGDAVLAAIRAWPRNNKFWPALAELIETIGPFWEQRRWLAEAIRQYRRPPTPTARA